MTESVRSDPTEKTNQQPEEPARTGPEKTWETPRMEDVSEQVMAQPYIRFT